VFLALAGQYGLFFFDDPSDNSRLAAPQATGDGATKKFPILRVVGVSSPTAAEPIGGLNLGTTVNVYLNGTLQMSGYSVTSGSDGTGAFITFTSAPGSGVLITADFAFYYLCFFTEDQQDYEEYFKNYYGAKSIKFRSTIPNIYTFPVFSTPPTPPAPTPGGACGTLSTSAGGTWDTSSGVSGFQTFSMDAFTVYPGQNFNYIYPTTTWKTTTSHNSGRYWIEFQAPSGQYLTLVQQQAGIVNSSFPTTDGSLQHQLGDSGGKSAGLGAMWLTYHKLWINGSGTHQFEAWYSIRQYINICWNFDSKLVWILTRDSPVTWNASATADPNASIGGWDFSSADSGPYYAAMSEIVRGGQTYPSILVVTNDNIGSAIGTRPECYVPW
jgi:hypothetical protein